MDYRQLGKSGVRVSTIGLGTNRFGTEKMPQSEVNRVIDAAVDAGINFLDSANVYTGGRSEETIGVALRGRWDKFVVATKYTSRTGQGPNDYGASRYHLFNAVEDSLRRLQSDHIDLFYVHRWDETTPMDEMLRGLDDLVRAGKLRYIGASQFLAWRLARANLLAEVHGWSPFIVIQSHYHMLERELEAETLSYCQDQGVGLVPYFPLAGGFLTGKYKRGQPPPSGSRGESNPYVQQYLTDANFDRIERLEAFAAERGRGLNELAIAWLLAHPAVSSVIAGATRLDQMQANVKAADFVLTSEEMEAIQKILA
jgi:aryl-alcohol dehydrogenase-like predicted oxidoreductase